MEFIVRRAVLEKDISEIKKMFLQYGIERTFDKALRGYQEEIDNLPGKYGPPSGGLLIGLINNIPVGCIAYQPLSRDTCEMKRLYVYPEYRRLGLGHLLVEKIIDLAIQGDYRIMKLDTHPSMTKAQRLYQKFGFLPSERYNDNPIDGILFFEKELM